MFLFCNELLIAEADLYWYKLGVVGLCPGHMFVLKGYIYILRGPDALGDMGRRRGLPG